MINEVTKDAPPHLTNNFLSTKRGFKMASLNITSLTKHIDELRILLANYPLDVISINETRLEQGILNSEICIPGYECDATEIEMAGVFASISKPPLTILYAQI